MQLKPSPDNIRELYLDSLRQLGIEPLVRDIRFVEDNWESPTLGAWGLGWEVWMNGMEVTQFTYFQQVGGIECYPVTGEITYGLERLAMYIQNVDNVYDLFWTVGPQGPVTYGDVFHQQEVEMSTFNFEHADTEELFKQFDFFERESRKLVDTGLPLPPMSVMKASATAGCPPRDFGDGTPAFYLAPNVVAVAKAYFDKVVSVSPLRMTAFVMKFWHLLPKKPRRRKNNEHFSE